MGSPLFSTEMLMSDLDYSYKLLVFVLPSICHQM